jgi:ubiquinone/menaquinone biosynthesis C-methylase UbiE
MLRRILQGSHGRLHGETIEHVRMYEMLSAIAFLGRRGRVFTRIVALSGAQPGDRVLDVGCGGGYLARLLAAAVAPNGRVTGVDPSSPAINYARRRDPGNCSFAVGVAQDLDLPDRSFDVVTSTLAVHHIPEAARPAAFGEMYRVTRPGGRLLVADFRPSGNRRVLHPVGHAMRHNNVDLLDDLVTAAGFHIEARGDLPMLRYLRAVRPDDR